MSAPRIVIGAARPNKLPALVLEHSIREHCPEAEVIHTWDMEHEPGGTLFSWVRWQACELSGGDHVIYMDADQVVLGDVRELWALPMDGNAALRVGNEFSVAKFDCRAMAEWPLERVRTLSYALAMSGKFLDRVGRLPPEWNSLDYADADTKLIHYTKLWTQPWIVPGHEFGGIWFDALSRAVQAGSVTAAEVLEEVRPSSLDGAWLPEVYPRPHVLDELASRV